MQQFSQEYSEIERNPRNPHKRKNQLIAQLLACYPHIGQSSFADLLLLLDLLKQSKINMLLFAQVIYPILEREIESGNLQAIKIMLQHATLLNLYNSMQKNYGKYNDIRLVNRYLQQDPDDSEVLQFHEACLRRFLSFAVHELPRGVLYGMNGATIDGCQELLDALEEYKDTCQKLQLDRNDYIHYCSTHFQGYRDYLLHQQDYKNYAEYIQKHHLEL